MFIKNIAKLILNNLISIKKNIKINKFNYGISPKTLFKLQNYDHKVIINKADLSGELIIGEGCKLLNQLKCSSNVELGRFVSINGPGTRLDSKINKIKIGSFSSIASNTIIQEYYHKYDRITSYFVNQNIFNNKIEDDIYSKGDIVLGEDVWVGSNSIILSGVNIGRGTIVGAGSVVTKDLPSYVVAAGNPARIIKNRFRKDTVEILEEIRWWEWNINKIKKNKKIFNYSEKQLLKNENYILSLKE